MNTLARLSLLPFPLRRVGTAEARADLDLGPPLALALVETTVAFAALESEWTTLFERCARPHQVFQTFPFLWTWHGLYSEHDTALKIVTGRTDGRLVLVWPLVVRRRYGLRLLTTMGDPVGQYSDALFDPALSGQDQDAALAFAQAIPSDVLALRRVRADAVLAPLLRRHCEAPTNIQHAPFVDFEGVATVDAFERRYSGKLRSSRRRHMRRLEVHGTVRFEHHAPSKAAMALVTTAMDFKRDWARRNKIYAPAIHDPRFEAFLVAAASGSSGTPTVRVSAMRCAETIVGVEIAIVCKGHLFGHVLAPRPGLEPYGIGGLLANNAIASALPQGYAVYDTLAPADAYKRDLTTTTVAVGDYHVAISPRGALYIWLWSRWMRPAMKTALRTWRGKRRHGLSARGAKRTMAPSEK